MGVELDIPHEFHLLDFMVFQLKEDLLLPKDAGQLFARHSRRKFIKLL